MRGSLMKVGLAALWLLLAPALSAEGLFWRIDAADGERTLGHLLGTLHSDDARVSRLSPAVQQALEASRSLTLELDFGAIDPLAVSGAMFAPVGSGLAELLSEPQYRRCVEALAAHHVPETAAARMHPWAALMTLSMPPANDGRFLDLVLYQRGRSMGLALYGLESMQEQLAVFSTLSLEEQLELLEMALDELPRQAEQMEAMIRAYADDDLAALVAITEAELERNASDSLRRWMVQLVDVRNRRMLERLRPRLAEGDAFIAIGALHLPGETGLLAQLRRLGYRLVEVE